MDSARAKAKSVAAGRRRVCPRSFGSATLLLLLCSLLSAAPPQTSGKSQGLPAGVNLRKVPAERGYEQATTPGALQFACASDPAALESFFQQRNVPFVPELVKSERRRHCHIFYEPTVPGFRAAPENDQATELFFDLETLNFLTLRNKKIGDALDITKAILAKVERPLDIHLGVALTQDEALYSKALEFHFPKTPHRIRLRNYAVEAGNPWVQDYLKAGSAAGSEKLLVTRRLFEGRADDGELFRPMLDMLTEERFVRSKLSWEGGDLQFVNDPANPGQNILFYGDSAKNYWGGSLTESEYEYVLKIEFGADRAVNLSKLVPHVDYFVAFLARENIALVSQPITEDYDVARAALDTLLEHYDPAIPAELQQLNRLFSDRATAFGSELGSIRKLLNRAGKVHTEWPTIEDGLLQYALARYLTSNCAADPDACLIGDGFGKLLHEDLPLARRWVTAAMDERTNEKLVMRLLSVIESQLPGFRVKTQPGIDAAVAMLEGMGFQVIRVPRMGGDKSLEVPWAGISYANAVLIDNQFFVPEFGLGKVEQAFFDRLQSQLPSHYEVVPVYARHMMLYNGGTHCVLAMVRKPAAKSQPTPEPNP